MKKLNLIPIVTYTVQNCDSSLLNKLRKYKPRSIKIAEESLTFTVSLVHKRSVSQMLKNYTVTMHQPRNILSPLNFLYSNPVLVCGLVVVLTAFLVLNGLVFRIQVRGLEGEEREQVAAFVRESGVRTMSWRGSAKRAANDSVAHAITAQFDFVAHSTVRLRGNRLVFTIYRTQTPTPSPTVDLVSTHNAVITEITVFSGTPLVRVGDPVTAGQPLVAATFQVGAEVAGTDEYGKLVFYPTTHPTTASAIVRGRVSHSAATVAHGTEIISETALTLLSQIMTDNDILAYDSTETFTRDIGGGAFVVEVVVSVIVDLVHY